MSSGWLAEYEHNSVLEVCIIGIEFGLRAATADFVLAVAIYNNIITKISR